MRLEFIKVRAKDTSFACKIIELRYQQHDLAKNPICIGLTLSFTLILSHHAAASEDLSSQMKQRSAFSSLVLRNFMTISWSRSSLAIRERALR